MKRTAVAHWSGNLKHGSGTLTSESRTLGKTNYSFKTRFEEGEEGTNPEELLAAAHAGCFTMSVVATLGKKCSITTTLVTVATVILKDLNIIAIHLSITGFVPGISEDEFKKIAIEAEKICLISKILCVPISLVARFINQMELVTAK